MMRALYSFGLEDINAILQWKSIVVLGGWRGLFSRRRDNQSPMPEPAAPNNDLKCFTIGH